MVAYTAGLRTKIAPHFGKVQLRTLFTYTPNLIFWSGASLAGIFVFVEGWPLFQQTIFKKIPLVGSHWDKEIAPEDKPN